MNNTTEETEPTPGALRTASMLYHGQLLPWNCIGDPARNLARMIDRNTKAPELLGALKGLTSNTSLRKLNVRKDFSLLNAHAYATKIIHEVTGGSAQ